MVWVHSDWHWRHENIYKFVYTDADGNQRRVRERFADAKEGDAFIEQAIRDTVNPKDTILFLGDLTMFRGNQCKDEFVKLFRGLPGQHWMLSGNHDHYPARHYVEAGFEKVRGSMLIDGVLFTHFPVHPSSISFKVVGNAHGHIHQHKSPDGPYFNCCVEVNDYRPVPFEVIKEQLTKLREAYGDRGSDSGQLG